MSNIATAKNVFKGLRDLRFRPELYTSPIGSLVVTAYILSDKKPSIRKINAKAAEITQNINHNKPVDLPGLADKDFIENTLKLFNIKEPPLLAENLAIVYSNSGLLFCPMIDEQIKPLREDGIYLQTQRTGKVVFPVTKDNYLEVIKHIQEDLKIETVSEEK